MHASLRKKWCIWTMFLELVSNIVLLASVKLCLGMSVQKWTLWATNFLTKPICRWSKWCYRWLASTQPLLHYVRVRCLALCDVPPGTEWLGKHHTQFNYLCMIALWRLLLCWLVCVSHYYLHKIVIFVHCEYNIKIRGVRSVAKQRWWDDNTPSIQCYL